MGVREQTQITCTHSLNLNLILNLILILILNLRSYTVSINVLSTLLNIQLPTTSSPSAQSAL